MGSLGKCSFRIRTRTEFTNSPRFAPIASLALLLVFIFLSQSILAQKPAAPRAKDAGNTTTIRTTVRQVLLDVVVTDHKNHAVRALRPEDFSILEDDEPQQILSFEPHTGAVASTKLDGQRLLPNLGANTFVNAPTPQDNLPLNVLLYDILNTPLDAQPFVRWQIADFLKHKPPGARFAIFVLSDKLHLAQGFTDDEDLLVSSLNRKEARASSPLLAPKPGNGTTLSDTLSDKGLLTQNLAGPVQAIDHLALMERSFFLERRVDQTIGAFSEISQFLAGWSGRKNLIWLSGAFAASVLPNGDAIDPFGAVVNYSPEIHEAVNRMTLSQVAVYPVDARGLMVSPVFSAANSRTYREGGSFGQAMRESTIELAAEHTTMDELAEGSGGRAFYNTNGLTQAIATAVEHGANYYTLSYSPTNKKYDGRLRRIHVKIARGSYRLSYRRSYFADDEKKFQEKTDAAPFAHARGTMERGAPLAHEIIFKVHVSAEGGPTAVTPEQIAELSQFKAFALRKKWDDVQMQRYSLEYWIPQEQLRFAAQPDGTQTTNLEFLAGAYDSDGTPIFGKLSTAGETITAGQFAKVRRSVFHGRQQFYAPAQAVWLRLAVRDPEHDLIGTIEIPLPLALEKADAK